MPVRHSPDADTNARITWALRDLAAVQTSREKGKALTRAAAAVFAQPRQLTRAWRGEAPDERIAGVGPSSSAVIREVLATGTSAIVERAIVASGRQDDVRRRRGLRDGFLSRAEVLRVLAHERRGAVGRDGYRGDFQMHSTWSDGSMSLVELVAACADRGYVHAAVTDHAHGLRIARGLAAPDVARQHAEIDAINEHLGSRFRLFKGIEANIGADGTLDLRPEEAARFEIVLAAPHSGLREDADQTPRLLRTIQVAAVDVLAHPSGRKAGERSGLVVQWPKVFKRAATEGVAIEIDGDLARQDLPYPIAAQALAEGCVFALDSDAHAPHELAYAETAIAHARLAGIPADRIINYWDLVRLTSWLARRRPSRVSSRPAARPARAAPRRQRP